MSMSSSFIYGYGFNCDCEYDKLIEFIKNHKDSFCNSKEEQEVYNEVINYSGKETEFEELFDDYCCDQTGMSGFGAVIANIMSRESGIRFEFCWPDAACGTKASVVFRESYPWISNDVEKNLTEEDLKQICTKYMEELRIDMEPDYLELEYYG